MKQIAFSSAVSMDHGVQRGSEDDGMRRVGLDLLISLLFVDTCLTWQYP